MGEERRAKEFWEMVVLRQTSPPRSGELNRFFERLDIGLRLGGGHMVLDSIERTLYIHGASGELGFVPGSIIEEALKSGHSPISGVYELVFDAALPSHLFSTPGPPLLGEESRLVRAWYIERGFR